MSQFEAFKEAVRDAADIVTVIGAEVDLRRSGRTLKGCSPFTGEKNASFHVWPDEGRWWDYSGGRNSGGDVFAYVMERQGMNFREALDLLAERFGVQRPHVTDEEATRLLAIEEEKRGVYHVLELAAEYYHRGLPTEVRRSHYQEHYGFTDDTIDRFRLGWATGSLWEYVTDVHGVAAPAALKSGLFVKLETGVVDFFQKRLVFPYTRRGRVCYFTARRTDQTPDKPWEESKYKKLLTRSEKFPYVSEHVVNDAFYNEDAARGAELVVITEGTPDCISAAQAGLACISPGTTTFREKDIDKLVSLASRATRIVICNDSEVSRAGELGALKTAKALWACERPVYLATLPLPSGRAKIDINELVKEQGPAALAEVIQRARWWPEVLLDRIPKEPGPALEVAIDDAIEAARRASPTLQDRLFRDIAQTARTGVRSLRQRADAMAKDDDVLLGQEAGTEPPFDGPRGAEIIVNDRQESEILADARRVFVAANEQRIERASAANAELLEPVFRRGSLLVRLIWEMKEQSDGSQHLRCLKEMNRDTLYSYLVRDATWLRMVERKDGHELLPASPLPRAPADLIELPPAELPFVDTIVSVPVFGKSGRLLDTPGVHPADGVWLEPVNAVNVAPVSTAPTGEEIARARSLFLDDVFVDFPFCTQADRANAMALTLLPFMRRLISGPTPLHLVEAPGQGNGKGLVVNIAALLLWGREATPTTLPQDEDEVRKTIASKLLGGAPLIFIDNLDEEKALSSVSLASTLTSPTFTSRRLGHNQDLNLVNRAIWVATGNNPMLARDFIRRSVRIRLDAKVKNAWEREGFKHDPLEGWVLEHRGELVWAALTLIQAWIAAGRVRGSRRMASFNPWAFVVGGVLEVAGIPGFLDNAAELSSVSDFEDEQWHEFVTTWLAHHQSQPVTVSALLQTAEKHDLLPEVLGEDSSRSKQSVRSKQTSLGVALNRVQGRIFGTWRVTSVPQDRTKRTRYALTWVAESTPALATFHEHGVDPWAMPGPSDAAG